MKIKITTSQEILRLRTLLQGISNISYSFSKLNQSHPIDTLSDEDAQQIITAYKQFLDDARDLLENQ
jgi:hypothetical protein